jgi:hypothetical protein
MRAKRTTSTASAVRIARAVVLSRRDEEEWVAMAAALGVDPDNP